MPVSQFAFMQVALVEKATNTPGVSSNIERHSLWLDWDDVDLLANMWVVL